MVLHSEELSEQVRNQIVRFDKGGRGYKIVSRLLSRSQNTVATVFGVTGGAILPITECAMAVLEK